MRITHSITLRAKLIWTRRNIISNTMPDDMFISLYFAFKLRFFTSLRLYLTRNVIFRLQIHTFFTLGNTFSFDFILFHNQESSYSWKMLIYMITPYIYFMKMRFVYKNTYNIFIVTADLNVTKPSLILKLVLVLGY